MAEKTLSGRKVAILATDGFEQSELLEPKKALEQAGATTHIVSLKSGTIMGWVHDKWGKEIKVDTTVANANPDEFDALLLPGGVMNPDKLRNDEKAVQFVRTMAEAGKPIAAICHGPWTLINAGVVQGRQMTSWPSLQMDLKNAGAEWVDQEVVTDNGLVTSRKPADIPAFVTKMIEEFAEGEHEVRRQQAANPEARPRSESALH